MLQAQFGKDQNNSTRLAIILRPPPRCLTRGACAHLVRLSSDKPNPNEQAKIADLPNQIRSLKRADPLFCSRMALVILKLNKR